MDSIQRKIVELCIQKKLNNEVSIYENIASIIKREFNVEYSAESIRNVSRKYRRINNLDENFNKMPISNTVSNKEVVTFNKDGSMSSDKIVKIKNITSITPEDLLKKHGFDISKFKLVSAKNSKWSSPISGGGSRELYSSNITVKPLDKFVWNEKTIQNLFDNIKIKKINKVVTKSNYDKNGKALILPLMDLHYCLKSYSDSSKENYNKDIAKHLFNYVIDDVLYRVKDKKFEKIYFTVGSDMLNCDNKLGTTTAGTQQVNDGEIEQAIISVTNLIINAIEKLKTISNVEVIHIPSNHDYMVSFGIANTLRVLYKNSDDVVVDYRWIERKYKVFGKTLLGFAHDIKNKDINSVIQSDARELMSETNNTVYLLAHYHHESVVDKFGTDVRRLPTISALSRWAYEKGYSHVRKCQTFILDNKFGICDILYTFVEN